MTTLSELWQLPASELAPKIARKEISPVELMKTVLVRAEKLQPVLNCFITLVPEMAMRAAQDAEGAVMRGQPLEIGRAHV